MGAKILQFDEGEVEELAAQGLSLDMMAYKLGTTRVTLSKRLKDNLSIYAAYKRGKQRDIQDVVNALKYNAIEKNNVAAQIFFLKNKDPDRWKDKHDIEHGGNITINTGFSGRTINNDTGEVED